MHSAALVATAGAPRYQETQAEYARQRYPARASGGENRGAAVESEAGRKRCGSAAGASSSVARRVDMAVNVIRYTARRKKGDNRYRFRH